MYCVLADLPLRPVFVDEWQPRGLLGMNDNKILLRGAMTGEELREWRAEIGLTSCDLARMLGISWEGSDIRNWERLDSVPVGVALLAEMSRDMSAVRACLRMRAARLRTQAAVISNTSPKRPPSSQVVAALDSTPTLRSSMQSSDAAPPAVRVQTSR